MYSFQKIFFVVFLTTLFCPDAAADRKIWDSDNVVNNIKNLLIRKGDKLTNTTRPKYDINQNNGLLDLNMKMPIIDQIIDILNCGSFPHSPNSHLKYSFDYSAKRLLLFQECDRYFKTIQTTDSLQVQCKYKKWFFNKIDCQITTCPLLIAPPGGHISTNDNTYNTIVYFWCDRGFSINGTNKLICEENALWNLPPPTCKVSHCLPLLPPRHGFMSSQKEIAVNQTVQFSCKDEYSIIGDAVLRCVNNGRWNTSAPVCKKMCIIPDFKNQSEAVHLVPKFKYLPIGSLVHQGQRVVFSCKPGYTVSSGISTCIGGLWIPPIHCRKICTAIEVKNGTYIWSKDSSTIEYSCQPGFQLVGQRKLSCTSNFTWDHEAPICATMCTLHKSPDVLSFRNKTTYEIIPFGKQILNGTKVYSLCQRNNSDNVVECSNGRLHPFLCLPTRLKNRLLEIFYNNEWRTICRSSFDVCSIFGYRFDRDRSCKSYYCYDFNVDILKKANRVVLSSRRANYCISCY